MNLAHEIDSAREVARDRRLEALESAEQYLKMAYACLKTAESYASQWEDKIETAQHHVDVAQGLVKTARDG